MPWRDPEAARKYARAYYQANREKLIAKAIERNNSDPERHRETNRKWYETHGREYRDVNRQKMNDATKRWRQRNPEKVRSKNFTTRLRYRYQLTVAEYEAMAETQNGLCAICGKPETGADRNGRVRRMAVDHNHATGAIRALLCHSCNVGIGAFLDDESLLIAAADYIKRFTE